MSRELKNEIEKTKKVFLTESRQVQSQGNLRYLGHRYIHKNEEWRWK
jgi:hypothetical protein